MKRSVIFTCSLCLAALSAIRAQELERPFCNDDDPTESCPERQRCDCTDDSFEVVFEGQLEDSIYEYRGFDPDEVIRARVVVDALSDQIRAYSFGLRHDTDAINPIVGPAGLNLDGGPDMDDPPTSSVPALRGGFVALRLIIRDGVRVGVVCLIVLGFDDPVTLPVGRSSVLNANYLGPRSRDLPIQGVSMSLRYPCALAANERSLDLSGGVLDEIEAEFVELSVDNDEGDGDGCELTFALVVDLDSPVEGRALPRTLELTPLCSLEFQAGETARCGECYEVRFEDGVENDAPAVDNLAAIDFESIAPSAAPGSICVVGPARFLRADCNASGRVDLTDPIALLGSLFLGAFVRPCDDACDADDDGRLTLADAIYSLNHLFLPNRPAPPAPGISPPAGPDPTADALGCEAAPRPCP